MITKDASVVEMMTYCIIIQRNVTPNVLCHHFSRKILCNRFLAFITETKVHHLRIIKIHDNNHLNQECFLSLLYNTNAKFKLILILFFELKLKQFCRKKVRVTLDINSLLQIQQSFIQAA